MAMVGGHKTASAVGSVATVGGHKTASAIGSVAMVGGHTTTSAVGSVAMVGGHKPTSTVATAVDRRGSSRENRFLVDNPRVLLLLPTTSRSLPILPGSYLIHQNLWQLLLVWPAEVWLVR